MNDLISRQAVLNLLHALPPEEVTTKAILIQSVQQMNAAQPEKRTEERTETHACDLIDRAEAIDALGKDPGFKVRLFGKSYDEGRSDQWFRDVYKLTTLPSAQPERKRGKWIAVTEDGDVYKRICSCCGQEAFFQNDDPDELYDGGRYELSDFCPHCGADMKEDDHE